MRQAPHRLGIYVGVTLPTGPSNIDILPPFLADGTLDVESLMLYELNPVGRLRLIFDMGYAHQGARARGGRPDFDVTDAFRYDARLAVHVGSRVLLSLEINGRYHFDKAITPVWTDNQHILEVSPGLRIEVVPRLVFEGGAGIALNRMRHSGALRWQGLSNDGVDNRI